jgi:hypothetical protein
MEPSSGDMNLSQPGISSGLIKPPLLNACLAYMRFMMNTRDKTYVQNSMCARFSLNSLKAAHKALSKYCDPSVEYNVRGPTKSSPREKAVFSAMNLIKFLSI